MGDICPISHEPMEDLVPSYRPSERKMLPLNDDKLGLLSKDQKRIDSFFGEPSTILIVSHVSSNFTKRPSLLSENRSQ